MAPDRLSSVLFISTLLFLRGSAVSEEDREVYIVYMGDLPKGGSISLSSLHTNILQEVVGSSDASKYLLRSYKRSFSGFLAELTKEEMKRLSGMKGVVSVFPNKKMGLLTTRSWDFMGFPLNSVRRSTESDVIVGVLDTGIWPESESFSDKGFGPPPSKWKGTCQTSSDFTCNNKIIGARYYRSQGGVPKGESLSARDHVGHGTLTASTAAGGVVDGASMLGFAPGTARGGVPSARMAVYKTCWSDGCTVGDVLSGFDDAIADGVDIISVAVDSGPDGPPLDYAKDPIAIGSFHSMKNGILTSAAAGNRGPNLRTIPNLSPWSLSVAASTTDRSFLTKLVLGNKEVLEDPISINIMGLEGLQPIIYAGDAPNRGFTSNQSRFCGDNSLDRSQVAGKIVFCDGSSHGDGAVDAKAAGSIISDAGKFISPFPFPLPTAYLNVDFYLKVQEYMNSTSQPTARIEKTAAVKDDRAPIVASYSSRGPNFITPDILGPDITAPGDQIMAAWAEGTSLSGVRGDNRAAKYSVASGTSMACPHASAVAAYVKSFHPDWSPAAIKSAIMTTATPMNAETDPDMELSYGAGLLNPLKAPNPGLIYDAGATDFIKFLCGYGYGTEDLRMITGDEISCTEATTGAPWDLNYPAFTLATRDGDGPAPALLTRTFHRTVTNVGSAASTYTAKVTTASPELTVKVEPAVLTFKSLGEKKTFTLTATAPIRSDRILGGSLVWNDGVFQVRSPIVAYNLWIGIG